MSRGIMGLGLRLSTSSLSTACDGLSLVLSQVLKAVVECGAYFFM
jgi:hypothetical protein